MKYDDTELKNRGIEYSAAVPFEKCEVINERKLGALEKRFTQPSLPYSTTRFEDTAIPVMDVGSAPVAVYTSQQQRK